VCRDPAIATPTAKLPLVRYSNACTAFVDGGPGRLSRSLDMPSTSCGRLISGVKKVAKVDFLFFSCRPGQRRKTPGSQVAVVLKSQCTRSSGRGRKPRGTGVETVARETSLPESSPSRELLAACGNWGVRKRRSWRGRDAVGCVGRDQAGCQGQLRSPSCCCSQ